ncbi:MAG TPA: DUF3667 domain-containing protein [Rhodanobacteraceae bacterium]|nr:DUF3667 domain-containing protein [Rhodanobacteraceae bacterium]
MTPELPSASAARVAARSIPADPFLCANCGTAYSGNYCPQCGQTTRSPMRHFGALVEDALDLFFNFDSRFVHTLPPLLLRPGFLSREYFAGRRIRYIPPFRLTFLLSVLAFLLMHFAIEAATNGLKDANFETNFNGAETPAEVQKGLKGALDGLEAARAATGGHGNEGFDVAEAEVRKAAARRLEELAQAPALATSTPAAAPTSAPSSPAPSSAAKPPKIELPTTRSTRVNAALEQIKGQYLAAARDPRARQALLASFFRTLPQAMLVLLPLFALLLKFTYLFKRRLYIEHLIVALHSHAFLFLLLLLLSGASLLGTTWPALSSSLHMVSWLLWLWLPLYLLLMQKRVYQQGWFLTVLKFGFLGICYVVLLSFTILGAAIAGAMLA